MKRRYLSVAAGLATLATTGAGPAAAIAQAPQGQGQKGSSAHEGDLLVVDRPNHKLNFFEHSKLVRSYTIAVGQPSYQTPAGRYTITSKVVNPPWNAPNEPWAGKYAGKTVPGGSPDNPIKARWMGLNNGLGIHGTDDQSSLGHDSSHGCIRMTIGDIEQLYSKVPMNTPVVVR